ncbi:hypothetical protein ACFLTB_02240 [Chloroflexota bacterium]
MGIFDSFKKKKETSKSADHMSEEELLKALERIMTTSPRIEKSTAGDLLCPHCKNKILETKSTIVKFESDAEPVLYQCGNCQNYSLP